MHTFHTVFKPGILTNYCLSVLKDAIFSPSTVKPVTKAPSKSKKTSPSQETSAAADSSDIFDDPLNALGGN